MTGVGASAAVDGLSQPPAALFASEDARIALLAAIGIVCHLWLRYASLYPVFWSNVPLVLVLAGGGLPLVIRLVWRGLHGEFGADLLVATVGFAFGQHSDVTSEAACGHCRHIVVESRRAPACELLFDEWPVSRRRSRISTSALTRRARSDGLAYERRH